MNEYRALLTQSAGDPVCKVKQNNCGFSVAFEKVDVGQYKALLSTDMPDMDNIEAQISDNFHGEDFVYQIKCRVEDVNRIHIKTLKDGVPTDGLLQDTLFIIRTQPGIQ